MPRLPGFATDCAISFDGARVPARTGEPVAVALLAAGRVLVSRSAKYHRPRGAVCLAGSCGSCPVRHDVLGLVDRLTPRGLDHHHLATWSQAANRAAVALSRRLAGLGRLPDPSAAAAALAPPAAEERVDALVVGAGPAGLAAAEALAEAGRRVLLAEREGVAGG